MATLFDELKNHKSNKKDKRKFGLVLPGGGMRGAYTAGAIVPLIENGFVDSFEHVVGSSAGAINGAYFIDEYLDTMFAYVHDLSTKEFINLLRRDKRIDVDFAIDEVVKGMHPFNFKNFTKGHPKLHIVATDAKNGRRVVLSKPETISEIYEELRASTALPLLYDKKILVRGRYYIDGAVADAIPVDVAIKLGCTDIVVIMTQQIEFYRNDQHHKRLVKHLIRKFAKNQTEAVKKILPTDEALLQINLRRLTRPQKKIRVYMLEPSNEEAMISLATIDPVKIEEFARLGISDMDTMLHKPLVK